jgi:hypothetical protein
MTIEWVNPDSIPVNKRTRRYGAVLAELRTNPGKWAKIGEGLFSASVTSLKKIHTDIAFKSVSEGRNDKGAYTYTVYACFEPNPETEENYDA